MSRDNLNQDTRTEKFENSAGLKRRAVLQGIAALGLGAGSVGSVGAQQNDVVDTGADTGASLVAQDNGEYVVPNTGGGTDDEPAFTLLPEGDTFNDIDGDGETSGPEDLSADVFLGYDTNNLYLRVELTDDTHAGISGADMWQADCLQWAVASNDTYGPEYGLSHVDGDTSIHRWIQGNESAGTSAIAASTARSETTTTYEATIPWNAMFAQSKEPGDSFPFSVLINERDSDGSRDAVLGWTLPGISTDKSPAGLGMLVLGSNDAPNPVVGDDEPLDPDSDGKYEDINGDSETTYGDVSDFFENYDGSSIQDNPDAFDFNENGRLDYHDIVKLFKDI
ncbi:sugar-binding protein [Haladaptatus sp. DYF46]|uniref:sugar-binding protein n=1 Tax=Haladaptatus sp. DYF46 TaxID=2886041 RepID=UPI001E40C021|nr:sugar-binding protein [Haladaptatus sp. DYF46]